MVHEAVWLWKQKGPRQPFGAACECTGDSQACVARRPSTQCAAQGDVRCHQSGRRQQVRRRKPVQARPKAVQAACSAGPRPAQGRAQHRAARGAANKCTGESQENARPKAERTAPGNAGRCQQARHARPKAEHAAHSAVQREALPISPLAKARQAWPRPGMQRAAQGNTKRCQQLHWRSHASAAKGRTRSVQRTAT